MHSFGWNFVHKKRAGHTDRQTDRHTHTHTQTNCSENITPPRFRGGVKKRNTYNQEPSATEYQILLLENEILI